MKVMDPQYHHLLQALVKSPTRVSNYGKNNGLMGILNDLMREIFDVTPPLGIIVDTSSPIKKYKVEPPTWSKAHCSINLETKEQLT